MAVKVSDSIGEVSTILTRPEGAKWLLVLGHGAGAPMTHAWMEAMTQALADEGIATLRYNFPYMEKKRGVPDSKPVLYRTVRAACEVGAEQGLPMLAGGKSMGGRMTSSAYADAPLVGVRGLVFFGFPLHPAGKPGTERAAHLSNVAVPMLFLQGTQDSLADLDLLRPICEGLGARATLITIEMADHGFHVPKKSGQTDAGVLVMLARQVRTWAESLDQS